MYGIEKEMIEDYGVESSVWIGGKRIVLGINEENTEKPRYIHWGTFMSFSMRMRREPQKSAT